MTLRRKISLAVLPAALVVGLVSFLAAQQDRPMTPVIPGSAGCVSCHGQTDSASMHPTGTVHLTCTECHGGNPAVMLPAGSTRADAAYQKAEASAHPKPKLPGLWKSAANPVRSAADWLKEDRDYIRFVNPGDLSRGAGNMRLCWLPCTGSTGSQHEHDDAGMAQCFGAPLYNNGSFPLKDAHFGESYSSSGEPRALLTSPAPGAELTKTKGILPELSPIARWEYSQPGNILRVFERGGGPRVDVGNPNPEETPGRPDNKLSDRGPGTLLATDPVFIGLQKTRLMDPLLSMPGTNDHPGDYRASGCSACHVVYANDRSSVHAASYAKYGNQGHSAQVDPTIPKNEPGHPIQHEFTLAIPTSQCITCHIHPGTNMVASYLGYTWWDNETDGDKMYPAKQHNPTDEEALPRVYFESGRAAARGKWF